VQDLVAAALDELPPGPVRVLSVCAGQGRDLLTVAARHRRGPDLTGRLVELDATNAALARAAIDRSGAGGLEVVEADAGRSDAYAGAVPADLVLVCGVFGNITGADVEGTIRFLPRLCAPGGWVVWTRHPGDGSVIDAIGRWFGEAGFESRALVMPEGGPFCVGSTRLQSDPASFRSGVRLFDFVR
jgi:ubiquinone/menaquinone biosynthesis C-methylase UbiE